MVHENTVTLVNSGIVCGGFCIAQAELSCWDRNCMA